MSIESEQYRQFISIYNNKTLSAAAKEMMISQPALSRSMQRLEDELCVHLFDRTNNRMILNNSGKLFLKYAHIMSDTESELIRAVREFDRSCRTISIGTCAPAPLWYILPIMSQLFPDMAISTELGMTEDILNGFKNNTFQLAIIPYEMKESNIICSHMIDENLFWALPKTHKFAKKSELSFSALDGENVLLYSGIGFWYNMHKEKMPHTHFLMQNERTAFNEIAKASTLPCFASDLSIAHDSSDNGRYIIPISDYESHAKFFCICKKEKYEYFKNLFSGFPISHNTAI